MGSSAQDPCHFGTDPDLWIRTLDYESRYGAGSGPALLDSGFNFFAYFFLKVTSVFKDNISLRSHKTLEFMDYLNWFAC